MQVKTQQLLLCSGNRMNDNMFRPLYLFQLGHHQVQTLVTKEEFYKVHVVFTSVMWTWTSKVLTWWWPNWNKYKGRNMLSFTWFPLHHNNDCCVLTSIILYHLWYQRKGTITVLQISCRYWLGEKQHRKFIVLIKIMSLKQPVHPDIKPFWRVVARHQSLLTIRVTQPVGRPLWGDRGSIHYQQPVL
jgi:hypothetical protein